MQEKTYFFLFYTSIFTKHSHQFIYSTHLFNKIFILLQFFIIPSLTAPLSLRPTTTNDHSTPNHHHHHPISIIKENQPTKQETQDRHGKPQRKTLKNQTKITEPRRERERERGRESFTVKLKPTPPLHHHNRPMLPTTKSKPSQKPKSKHKPPWDLYPSNPRPMTSCYSRPHDYLRPHKPNTTHKPTHPKPILRERERERASFDDQRGVVWWSVWRGLKQRNPERWEWKDESEVDWGEIGGLKWRKTEMWEWEAERVRWRREKQI